MHAQIPIRTILGILAIGSFAIFDQQGLVVRHNVFQVVGPKM